MYSAWVLWCRVVEMTTPRRFMTLGGAVMENYIHIRMELIDIWDAPRVAFPSIAHSKRSQGVKLFQRFHCNRYYFLFIIKIDEIHSMPRSANSPHAANYSPSSLISKVALSPAAAAAPTAGRAKCVRRRAQQKAQKLMKLMRERDRVSEWAACTSENIDQNSAFCHSDLLLIGLERRLRADTSRRTLPKKSNESRRAPK
jgi:hypothetical protein